MPNPEKTPKWLAFTIPIALPIAIPITLSLTLLGVGCSGDKTEPLGNDPGIAAITLNKGALEPPYAESVKSYSVAPFHSDASDFALTVALKDPQARLTINGKPASSGAAFPIALSEGNNTINIEVEAANGKNSATITASAHKPNTRVYVLDGLGGAPVEGAMLTLKDANNKVLEDNIPVPADKQGEMLLGLDPTQKYHIYAKGPRSAEAGFTWFDPSKESTVALYCLPGWAPPFTREAPVIERVSFGSNPYATAVWKDVPQGENQLSVNHADIPFIKITAVSGNPINYEPNSGTVGPPAFPIQVAMDGKAWEGTPYLTVWPVEAAAPFNIGANLYFRTTYILPMPFVHFSPEGDITYAPLHTPAHWLDIVVYDQANNRAEQRLYLTLSDTRPQASDTDISSMSPRILLLEGSTSGVSMNVSGTGPVEAYGEKQDDAKGVQPVDRYGVSYYNYLEFALTDYATIEIDEDLDTFPLIRGFEVHRSTDNVNFDKVDAINYVTGTRGLYRTDGGPIRQRFQYYDFSPELAENVTYYYKIRAFNSNPAGGGYSQLGGALSNKLLPAFVTQLAEPAHYAVLDNVKPVFKFKVTNPELLDPDVSGIFYFSLVVKDAQSATNPNMPIIDQAFSIDCRRKDSAGNPWAGYYVWYLNDYNGEWIDATYRDERGATVPFIRVEDDTVIVEIDNPGFLLAQSYRTNNLGDDTLKPGRSYEWNIFGEDGGIPGYTSNFRPTNSAFFYKGWDSGVQGASTRAFSFGSTISYGLGSPGGFFIFTIDPAAK